jgi:NADH:ubiquinone oxidoreductase subunit E
MAALQHTSHIPHVIRTVCESVLKCKTKRLRPENKKWEDHYPRAAISDLLSFLQEVRPYLNESTTKIVDDILQRSYLWLDKEATPQKWVEFEKYIDQLQRQFLYIN